MKKGKIKMWYHIPREIKRKKYVNERYSPTDYMNLYFFETRDEMYEYVDKVEIEPVERDYIARCYNVLKRYFITDSDTGEIIEPTDKYSPYCGNIYFVINEIGANTVAHECLHATLGYFARKIDRPERIVNIEYDVESTEIDCTPCDDIEELVCYMHGNLVEQVWVEYFKIKDGGESEQGESG